MAEIKSVQTTFGVYGSNAALPLPADNRAFTFNPIKIGEKPISLVWWEPIASKLTTKIATDLANFNVVQLTPAQGSPGYVTLTVGAIPNPADKAEVRIKIFGLSE